MNPQISAQINIWPFVCEFLEKSKLNIQNLIGIGTDGASNLCRKNKSLFTLLKEIIPHLQLIKCVCHSLNICASNACDELPSSLEFLVREIRSWFSHSSLRQLRYRDLFQTLYEGKQPPRIVQLSTTRWLAWYGCIKSVLDQWLLLKTHFNLISKSKEGCYTSRTLSDMINDDTHLLYLLFLKPVLYEVTQVNIVFQGTNNSLRLPETHLPCNSVDFGHQFKEQSKISLQKQSIDQLKLNLIMERAARFLLRLCHEIVERLPQNLKVIEKLKYLSPSFCFDFGLQPIVTFKDFFPNLAEVNVDKDLLEIQWRTLGSISFNDIFPGNAAGDHTFKELSEFALRLLSLPISNAVVERIFSVMNATKTKVRNRMSQSMLVALIRIKVHNSVKKQCCTSFIPSKQMLNLFDSKMYDSDKSLKIANFDDSDDLFTTITILNSVEEDE
ncbi:PREDICTED: zinc finger protein 862-like [Diuraphis noxia]|uniref:zinc finger protein 862-like n=1 Tax=Diuraphis noxia TaxID=143948 RepID=UPI000763894D|nr:PREDICTED: zinc finger protein 862-like [Diuraphis noxia]